MREWLTAREIAAEQLPYMPTTESALIRYAKRERWNEHPAYAKDREGQGGGIEYHFRLLPSLAQIAYVQRYMIVGEEVACETEAQLPAASTVSDRAAKERDARLAVVAAFERFSRGLRLHQRACLQVFCDRYEMGNIKVDDWVKDLLPTVSTRSLLRWRHLKNLCSNSLAIDRSKARAGTGTLDIANGGKVRAFLLALIAHAPHLSAPQIQTQCRAEFGDTLNVLSKGVEKTVPMPPVRTFQHFLKSLKSTHAVELTKLTNPDRFRSTMALSGVGTLRHVTEPNMLWQIDASPVDALCVDGRHAIYACIDIATRRAVFYVSRTPRASAVALLIRRAILALGKPETIKTDNGSDFVANDTKRLFAALDIEMQLSDAYSPQQKGHVERLIKTFQHQFASLLPGYVGHSVADRKQIEDRKSFADRLGQDTAEAFGVSLTGAELQDAINRWAETMYSHAPHSGLKGQTPFQAAAASTAIIQTVDERALDVLLMPVAGGNGQRRVTKFGIRIDHYHYVAASILPGADVFVRRDPNDMGRVHAFSLDQGTYLGEAICPELSGVHPETWLAAQKELRSEIIAEKTTEIKKGIRDIVKGPALHERALSVAARNIPNVVALPKRTEEHTTPQIAAALDVTATTASKSEAKPLSEKAQELHAAIQREHDFKSDSKVIPISPEAMLSDSARMFKWALATEARIAAGEELDDATAGKLVRFQRTGEYQSMKDCLTDFGLENTLKMF